MQELTSELAPLSSIQLFDHPERRTLAQSALGASVGARRTLRWLPYRPSLPLSRIESNGL